MDSNEQYVREKWVECDVEDHRLWCGGENWRFVALYVHSIWAASQSAAWQAAAEFTRAHEKKISEVEEEIEVLMHSKIVNPEDAGRGFSRIYAAYKRILAARQAALDELRKGWRG